MAVVLIQALPLPLLLPVVRKERSFLLTLRPPGQNGDSQFDRLSKVSVGGRAQRVLARATYP